MLLFVYVLVSLYLCCWGVPQKAPVTGAYVQPIPQDKIIIIIITVLLPSLPLTLPPSHSPSLSHTLPLSPSNLEISTTDEKVNFYPVPLPELTNDIIDSI